MADKKKTKSKSRKKKVATKPADHNAIAKAAYYKWLEAGKPASDGVEFWLAAESEHTRTTVDMVEITD